MSSGRTRFVLIVSLLLSLTSEAQGDEKPCAPRPVADAERIGRDSFARWAATSSRNASPRVVTWKRTGVPALTRRRWPKSARTYPDAEVRRRAAELSARIENGLDQLLADYRFFGLPLPPDRAPLVRFEEQPSRHPPHVAPRTARRDDYILPPPYAASPSWLSRRRRGPRCETACRDKNAIPQGKSGWPCPRSTTAEEQRHRGRCPAPALPKQ